MNGRFTRREAAHLTDKEYAHYMTCGLIEGVEESTVMPREVRQLQNKIVSLEATVDELELELETCKNIKGKLRHF